MFIFFCIFYAVVLCKEHFYIICIILVDNNKSFLNIKILFLVICYSHNNYDDYYLYVINNILCEVYKQSLYKSCVK